MQGLKRGFFPIYLVVVKPFVRMFSGSSQPCQDDIQQEHRSSHFCTAQTRTEMQINSVNPFRAFYTALCVIISRVIRLELFTQSHNIDIDLFNVAF